VSSPTATDVSDSKSFLENWSTLHYLDKLATVSRAASPGIAKQGFTVGKPVQNSGLRDPKKSTVPPFTADEPIALKVDTTGWITRNAAADLMRVSVTTIANYERRGKLHPQMAWRADARGIQHHVAVYSTDELFKELPRGADRPVQQDPGELAARAFEHFDNGLSMREVVIKLRATPGAVQELRESWLETGGHTLTITPEAQKKFAALVGEFSGVTELLEKVEARLSVSACSNNHG
jgi:hypothetical protein